MRVFFIILLMSLSQLSMALIIKDTYGDKDGFGAGIENGDFLYISDVAVKELDDASYTDEGLYGGRSWSHSYDISAFQSISSAWIEVFVAGLGAYGGPGSLYIDGTFVSVLTDGDTCGDPIGCFNTAHVDIINLTPFLNLLDGVSTITVSSPYSGDYWALDYSELRIEGNVRDVAVPEPSAFIIMCIGIVGLAIRKIL